MNILLRMMEIKAFAGTIRFLTYGTTSFPGANEACFGKWENLESPKPTTLSEIFWTRWPKYNGHPADNCGDIVFSGGTFECLVITLLVWKYNKDVLKISENASYCVNLFVGILCLLNVLFSIMARDYYSFDCVIALYFTPLFWYWFVREVHQTDMCPLEADKIIQRFYCRRKSA